MHKLHISALSDLLHGASFHSVTVLHGFTLNPPAVVRSSKSTVQYCEELTVYTLSELLTKAKSVVSH